MKPSCLEVLGMLFIALAAIGCFVGAISILIENSEQNARLSSLEKNVEQLMFGGNTNRSQEKV